MINVYNWYSSPLINIEAGDGPVKKFNGVVEGSSFDQILDLNTVSVSDSNKAQTDLPPPMMAFEESIQQQNNNTAGENTKYISATFSLFLHLQISSLDGMTAILSESSLEKTS